MLGERLTQGQDAAGGGVADEGVLVGAGERAAQKTRPDVIGKGVGRDAAFGKAGDDGGGAGVQQRLARGGQLRSAWHLLNAGDVVASLRLGVDVALDEQLGVGVLDGDDADAEVFGEHSLGGQLVTCVQHTAGDIGLDAAVEMGVHALAV